MSFADIGAPSRQQICSPGRAPKPSSAAGDGNSQQERD
jgi:hypothetical protein